MTGSAVGGRGGRASDRVGEPEVDGGAELQRLEGGQAQTDAGARGRAGADPVVDDRDRDGALGVLDADVDPCRLGVLARVAHRLGDDVLG